ncbi:MAG: glycosyltransferase family 9 protein [Candidatus Melainabacteria bacterium]|nr:glycosyltransferase family 9 protein [Candidatus Melainabacteria bacterium]
MKILIVRLSSLGDIVHSLPLVHCLQEKYPDAQIDWLTGNEGFEFLSLVKEIKHIYLPDFKNIGQIQNEKYDYVIDVQGLFKSAFLSKISFGKIIVGFKNTRESADIFYDRKIDVGNLFKTDKHIVDLNLKLVSELINEKKIPGSLPQAVKFLIPQISESQNTKLLETLSRKKKPKIAIFPVTTWKSKLWPLDYWFNLLKMMSNDFFVYLCAGNNDKEYIDPLINKLESEKICFENLVGKTSIKDLIYLLENIDLAIGMDSFGLHLASAIKNDYGVPEVIGIYGPTSLKRNGPYNSDQNCLYLSEMACIACRKKICPLGHHKCMKDIVPAQVQKMIDSKIAKILQHMQA